MGALSCKRPQRVWTESGQIPIYNEFNKSFKLQVHCFHKYPGNCFCRLCRQFVLQVYHVRIGAKHFAQAVLTAGAAQAAGAAPAARAAKTVPWVMLIERGLRMYGIVRYEKATFSF